MVDLMPLMIHNRTPRFKNGVKGMRFNYSGSQGPHLRWATKRQIDIRWNEFVAIPFSKIDVLFKSSARAVVTSNSVEISASMLIQGVDMSLETSFEKILGHLTNYRDRVTTFIKNAFRHLESYEDHAIFFNYMELSKNEAIKNLKQLSRSRLVSDLKRHFGGLDDVFSEHIAAIEACFDGMKTRHEILQLEDSKGPSITI